MTAPRPLPPFQSIKDVSRIYEREGRKFVDLPLDSFETFIRCILRCVPFDESLYLHHYPGMAEHSNPYRHWWEHGYFEGRLVYGWEQLPFDFKELLDAPEQYFPLVQKAAAAAEGRYYRKAEEAYQEAIAVFPLGFAARIGLADLLFKLRRSQDSEAVLRRALELRPESPRANGLLIEVLVDLGLDDLACTVSLNSGLQANTARQVLRLLRRGDLSLARRQVRLASDSWVALERYGNRIEFEWRDTRERLARLHASVRKSGSMSVESRIEMAHCLARLGFVKRSRSIVDTILAEAADQQEVWSSTKLFLSLVDAVRIAGGAKSACDVMTSAPAAVLAQPDVLKGRFDLAYQSGDRNAIEALSESFASQAIPPDLLETWCRSLIRRGNFDEAIRVCSLHWPSYPQNRWLSSVVLQIGFMQGRYSGVSLDEDPGHANLSSRIPRRIMQFWDRETPPVEVQALINGWSERNPGYEHVLFSNETATAFLRERYDEDYVRIFNYCHHPAMKADFFRVAYLAAVGGIYVDADEYCNMGIEPLLSSYPARDAFIPIAEAGFFITNGFLFGSPGHPFFQTVLRHVVTDMQRAMQLGEKPDIWHTTGPSQYGRTFAELLIAPDETSRSVVARTGLVYAHERSRYISSPPMNYKTTKEGNWSAA